MERVDFNDLPRTTRERFVRSLVSDSPVARPICQRVAAARTAGLWYLLVGSGAAALAVVTWIRFGAPDAPVQDVRFIGGYVGAWAAIALGLSMIARRGAIKGSLPFAPGVYVFPVDLVDARTRRLVLYPLTTLKAFDVVHHEGKGGYTRSTLRFVFPTTTFTFESKKRDRAEAEARAVEEAKAKIASVLATGGSLAGLAAIDPFADARARKFAPARDHGLLARGRPSWTQYIWVITVVAALAFGALSWASRNAFSDEAAFARISSALDVNLADAYAKGGGRRAAEVASVVVPRAALAAARQKSTPTERADALASVLQRFPRSGVDAELRAALAEAQHAVFTEQAGAPAGLQAFVARFPAAADVPAAKKALAEIYQRALAEFTKRADTADRSSTSLVPVVLAYAEATGNPVEVRVRGHHAPSLAEADKYVASDAHRGESETVSGAVVADTALQATLVVALERTLDRVFHAHVVPLRLGAPLDGPAPIPGTPPLAEVTAPTIVVDYQASWGRATYASPDPRARFVGVVVSFDVAVQVPNQTRVIHFATTVDPPETLPFEYAVLDPAFAPILAATSSKDHTIDRHAYTAMLVRSFDQLASRWANAFVKPVTAASKP